MKIGILTFHRAENFGAVLQAYALQTFLQNEGCDAFIIDYRNLSIEAMYDVFNPGILFARKNIFKSLRLYITRFNHVQNRYQCKYKYRDFRKKFFNLTEKVKTLNNLAKEFDCIIAGSDQIWNLHLTGGLDRNYFLAFSRNYRTKKISYAVSAEYDPCDLLSHYKDKISKLLNDFDYLSVREEFFKNELQKYTAKEIAVCLDPTFLLKGGQYKEMTWKPLDKSYILVYHMTPIPMGTMLAEKIATVKDYKVIEIHIGYGEHQNDERHKINLGPLDILSYIAWAEEIITSSFHGLALSLIMQKDVWVVNKGNNLRQRNLLTSLGLEERLLTELDDYKDQKINYDAVEKKLGSRIKYSKDFILHAVFENYEKDCVLS